MPLKIRPELPEDIPAIRTVHLQAFETDAEANLVDALRNLDIPLISMVAEYKGQIIGHILFSPVTVDCADTLQVAGLAPMAVLPASQKQGIGTMLVNEGLDACKRVGYSAVVVLGHPDYYPRFGFSPSVNFGLRSEYDVPAEVFMVKELRKGALQGITGTVKYHPAFNEFS